MMDRLTTYFSKQDFSPHRDCDLWKLGPVSIHVISDILIGLAYFIISLMLHAIVKKQIHFDLIYLYFGIFLVTVV